MSETNIQRWSSRPIFLSSTFRDMHAERDYLRHHVFPRLEEELLKRRYHLEWIDLRQGVEFGEASSEEERELHVLKVCFDEIKRSRPFLIALLGDRYGWVPPPDRLNAATLEANFSGKVQGRSVTALEIEFGLLKESPEQKFRCFFYLREPLPYYEMPPEVRATYSEQFADNELAGVRWSALKELKKRLIGDVTLAPRIRHYSAGWDAQKNTVTGLEKWGDDVFQDLWRELEEETSGFAARPAQTWEEIERASLAEFVEQRSRDFTGRDDVTRLLLDLAKSAVSSTDANDSTKAQRPAPTVTWGACVTGLPGAGKSALFAKLVSELELDNNVLLLANAAGISPRSASVDAVLRRWIAELATFLGENDPLLATASYEEVDQTFASLLEHAAMKQRVVVLLDALNQFEPTPRGRHVTWLPQLWPPNSRLIVTTLSGAESESLSQRSGVEEIELPPLTETDAREIGHGVWKRYHCPWSDAVWQALAAKTVSDIGAAVGNPLWTTLAFEQLALLDADDFTRAERQFADESNPQARLTQLRLDLVERMPPDVPGLYMWLLAQTEKLHGEAWARAFAVAIALSRHGWRERDLRVLVPELAQLLYPETPATEIPPLQLAALRRSFRAHLAVRGELQQWDFFHVQMREAIARKLSADQTTLHAVLADHLLSLPVDDPLRETETMFHLLAADDHSRAALYYADDLTAAALWHTTASLAEHLQAIEGASSARKSEVIALLRTPDLGPDILLILCQRFIHLLDNAVRERCTIETRATLVETIDEVISTLGQRGIPAPLWLSPAADCKDRIGDLSALQLNYEKALAAYQDALSLRQFLERMIDSADWLQRDISVSHNKIGEILIQLGRIDEALTEFRNAYSLRTRDSFEASLSVSDRRDLSTSHNRLSLALDSLGRLSEALEEIEKAISIRESLAREAVGNEAVQRDVDTVRHQRARILAKLNRTDEAQVVLEGVLERCLERSRREPGNLKFPRDIAVTYEALGGVALLRAGVESASTYFLKGAACLRQALRYDPGHPTMVELFVSLLLQSADLDLVFGNRESAARSSSEVCTVLRTLSGEGLRSEDERAALAGAESLLAETHFRNAEIQAAREGFERSVENFEQLPNLLKLKTTLLEKAFHAHGRLGSFRLEDPSQVHEAERLIKRSVEIGSQLLVHPDCQAWIKGDLAANLQKLGELLADRGERAKAIRAYLSAATFVDQQLDDRAEDSQWLQQVMQFHWEVLKLLGPDDFLPDGHSSSDTESQQKEIQFAIRVEAAAARSGCDSTMIGITLTLIAGLELAVGERDAALEHLKRSLSLRLQSERKPYEPAVVLDVQRIVALEKVRRDLGSAAAAVRDGITLLQRHGGNHSPYLTGLWSMLGGTYQQIGNREEARAAFAEAYEILLEVQGPEVEETRKTLNQILTLDTHLEEFDRAATLCLDYFDVHPEIQRILKPLGVVGRAAARIFAARHLVYPIEQFSGKDAMLREMVGSADLALRENDAEEGSLQDRMNQFLVTEGEAFISAALAIVNVVLNRSAS